MDELRKSIEQRNIDQRVSVESMGQFSTEEELLKALPIGTVNKYGKTKTVDGWKYVKKGTKGAAKVEGSHKPNSPQTSLAAIKESIKGTQRMPGMSSKSDFIHEVERRFGKTNAAFRGSHTGVVDFTIGMDGLKLGQFDPKGEHTYIMYTNNSDEKGQKDIKLLTLKSTRDVYNAASIIDNRNSKREAVAKARESLKRMIDDGSLTEKHFGNSISSYSHLDDYNGPTFQQLKNVEDFSKLPQHEKDTMIGIENAIQVAIRGADAKTSQRAYESFVNLSQSMHVNKVALKTLINKYKAPASKTSYGRVIYEHIRKIGYL